MNLFNTTTKTEIQVSDPQPLKFLRSIGVPRQLREDAKGKLTRVGNQQFNAGEYATLPAVLAKYILGITVNLNQDTEKAPNYVPVAEKADSIPTTRAKPKQLTMVKVRFLKTYQKWNSGEVALFTEKDAEALCQLEHIATDPDSMGVTKSKYAELV